MFECAVCVATSQAGIVSNYHARLVDNVTLLLFYARLYYSPPSPSALVLAKGTWMNLKAA